MQGVAVKDTGFFAGIERFGSFTLVQTENAAAAAAAAITVSSEDSNRASNVTSCDIPRSFPRAESTLFNCNGNLTGRTATLRPGQAMDAIANAEEIPRGKLLPSFQDLMASSDPTELARHPNEAEFLSSSSSGIMMGGFFCDPKNISGSHGSLSSSETLSALEKYFSASNEDALSAEDLYSCDEFRMFEFKVRRCMRGRSHDWTECPFAHPGEKARRRDPRRFHYSGSACPDFRKGNCKRGDACEFAHGVFECWLHPARYRTQPCKDARNCRRRVCFFAHTPEQLRLGLGGGDGGGSFHRQMSSLKPQANVCSCCASFDGNTTIPTVFGDAFDGNATIQTVFGDAFDNSSSSSVSYDRHGCLSHGLFDGSCSRLGGCHTGSPRFTVSARSSFNCANHAGICCVSSQISSPTSTLVGLSPSPPTLSPPLSPAESPPASPEDWRATLTHSLPVAAAAHSAFLYGQLPLDRITCSQAAIAQLQESSNAATPLPGSIPIASLQLQQIESSMPTLLIPRRLQQAFASAPASPHSCPTIATTDLVAALQQMDLNKVGNSIWLQTQPTQPLYSSGPSPLRRSSQSVPSTPSGDHKAGEMWEAEVIEEDEVNLPRVESGRVLRAKIYGKLRKTNRLDSADSPDLGWVNDLVD